MALRTHQQKKVKKIKINSLFMHHRFEKGFKW